MPRTRAAVAALFFAFFASAPACAETAAKIDPADTAFMIAATALVLMMTLPGLALFYSGMVRKKNVLATMAQSLIATAIVSLLWGVVGYSLAFSGEGAYIGDFARVLLSGVAVDTVSPLAKTIPEMLFMAYQMTFAVITVALVGGSTAERMSCSSFILFCVLWLFVVYVPSAHWVWGGGFLQKHGLLDFAGGTVVHINAGVAGLVAALIMGKRQGYGRENMAPFDLALAVIGTGLLWVGWFGFNGGSALTAGSRAVFAIVATHLAACAVCYYFCTSVKHRFNYDDTLDVFGVHGVGGILGTLLAGVFATRAVTASADDPGVSGLLEGDVHQFLVQAQGVGLTVLWCVIGTFIVLKLTNLLAPLRVGSDLEREGLDIALHGEALHQ